MVLGRDGIAGLIILVVSLALFAQSLNLPQLPLVPVGPGFYPRIVLGFLAVCAVALVVQDWRKHRTPPAPGAARRNYPMVVAVFALVGAYIWLLPLLGYRTATVLFVAALQAALDRPRGWRQWAVVVAVALATSAITYSAFELYLLVLLPRGSWTGF